MSEHRYEYVTDENFPGLDVYICVDCGGQGQGDPGNVRHYSNCIPGESTKWEDFYTPDALEYLLLIHDQMTGDNLCSSDCICWRVRVFIDDGVEIGKQYQAYLNKKFAKSTRSVIMPPHVRREPDPGE